MRVALARRSGPLVCVAIALVGLTVVKWWPYGSRLASLDMSFGPSLLAAPPVEYATRYLGSVWSAMVLGIVLAAAVETLLPRSWLPKLLGRVSPRSSFLGGVAALPAMMCSCCAAPVAVGLRRTGVSSGAALAFWLGNPMLNPAVLAFLVLALPWQFAALRLVAGAVLVFGVCQITARLFPDIRVPAPSGADLRPGRARFLPAVARYALTLLPEWLALGLVLGIARAWLVPAIPALAANDPVAIAAAAAGGTLFMIPTAGEIPVAQALLALGLGGGPVAALVVTLPALSLPSLAMVWRSFPQRALLVTTLFVALVGATSGFAAVLLGL